MISFKLEIGQVVFQKYFSVFLLKKRKKKEPHIFLQNLLILNSILISIYL